MSVTIDSVRRVDLRSWIIVWSSDLGGTPTFYVYQDGVLVNTTVDTEMVFMAELGECPLVEILDDADAVPMTAYPGRLTLAWYATAAPTGTDHYKIEEYVDAAWVIRANVREISAGYYKWKTRFLEDSTSHQFKITPVGVNGNDGAATTLVCLMVRHPNPPAVDYVYDDGTGKVTVSE